MKKRPREQDIFYDWKSVMTGIHFIKPYARSAMLLWKRYSARLLAASTYLKLTKCRRPLLFIVGCGRSGTTILGDLFSKHKDVKYFFEPYHLWAAVDPGTDVTNLNIDLDNSFIMKGGHASLEIRKRFQRLFQSAPCGDDHRIAVEKTPHNAVRIDYIEALADEARYIHIVRDGLQVARSIAAIATENTYKIPHKTHYNQWWGNHMKKWNALSDDGARAGYFQDEVGLLSEPIQWAAYEWLVTVNEIDRVRHRIGERLLEIRYSDLTEHPAEVLKIAARFAGLTPNTSWIRRACKMVSSERRQDGVELRLPPQMCKAFNDIEERFGFSGRAVPSDKAHEEASSKRPSNDIPTAIVCSSQTPYRLHMHRRFVREIPEVRFHSLFAHERDIGGWRFESHPDLGTVCFGMGEEGSTRLLPRNFMREWSKAGRMIRWMEEQQIRVVILIGYDVANLRVLGWCRQRKIPCFLWGDNNVRLDRTQMPRSLVKRAVLPRIISQCSAILVCGRLGKELYLKYGADPKAVFFSPCEPDYALIEQVLDEDRHEVRVFFNLVPTRRRIVFSGRLSPEKRVDLLIGAFSTIASCRPDWDLLVIGDGPLREALQMKVPLDIRHRVTWTGFIDRHRTISALYSLCDVLVLPSDRDSWGLVMNEAAAAGLAMAASDVVGAAKELIRSNINGFVFPSGSEEGLADCLMKITDPNRIDDFRSASKEVLREWRRDADPVDGLRKAMVYAGVLLDRKVKDAYPFDGKNVL